jgi:hypothetical protein
MKVSYSNKDELVAGDITVATAKGHKTNVLLDHKKFVSAKHSYSKV